LRKQLNFNKLKKAKSDLVLPFYIFFKKSVGVKENLCTFAAQFKGTFSEK